MTQKDSFNVMCTISEKKVIQAYWKAKDCECFGWLSDGSAAEWCSCRRELRSWTPFSCLFSR